MKQTKANYTKVCLFQTVSKTTPLQSFLERRKNWRWKKDEILECRVVSYLFLENTRSRTPKSRTKKMVYKSPYPDELFQNCASIPDLYRSGKWTTQCAYLQVQSLNKWFGVDLFPCVPKPCKARLGEARSTCQVGYRAKAKHCVRVCFETEVELTLGWSRWAMMDISRKILVGRAVEPLKIPLCFFKTTWISLSSSVAELRR